MNRSAHLGPVTTSIAFLISALSGVATAQAPDPVLAENLEEITATVTAVDSENRLVTLESQDGREVTVQAGEQVRNFERIEVGDRVEATFYEALAAAVTDAPPGAEPALLAADRAPLGERPAGAIGVVYTAVVTIDDVDPQANTVKFTGPNGPREVNVQRPELQEFIKGLKAGDRVEVTYGEALAVDITPRE